MHSQSSSAFIALLFLILLLAAISVSRLFYPYDVGHFEACTWTPALLSARGENPYAFATREPYVMAPYGYAYYLLVGAGFRVFGLQFWFGRLLTLFSAAVCVWCVYRIVRSFTEDRQSGLLAALALLSGIALWHWIGVHRPDLPALAFGMIAMLWGAGERGSGRVGEREGGGLSEVRFGKRGVSPHYLVSLMVCLLLALAFFCKQTTILPALVIAGRMAQVGRLGRAATVLIGTGALIVAVGYALNMTSAGGYVWQHVFLMPRTPMVAGQAMGLLRAMLKSPATYLGLGLLAAAAVRGRFRFDGCSPKLLFGIYFLAASALAFVTSARGGAYVNYYLEATIALSICVGMAWHTLSRRVVPATFVVIVALYGLAGAFEFQRMARAERARWRSLDYYHEIVAALTREVPAGMPVISVHPELAVAAGREYHFGDFMQYLDGRSEELRKTFADALASGRYPAVIWHIPDDPLLKGYRRVPMQHAVPAGYYPVYLWVRTRPRVLFERSGEAFSISAGDKERCAGIIG